MIEQYMDCITVQSEKQWAMRLLKEDDKYSGFLFLQSLIELRKSNYWGSSVLGNPDTCTNCT